MRTNDLTKRPQPPTRALKLTPDLPGFMRESSSVPTQHQQSPDEPPRRRRRSILDIPYYADDFISSINNGEDEEDDKDEIIVPSFFIPGITGAARCLDGKSARFDGTSAAGKVVHSKTRRPFFGSGHDNEMIKIPGQDEDDAHNRTYGLESIHYENLSQSVDYLRSLLLQRSNKDRK